MIFTFFAEQKIEQGEKRERESDENAFLVSNDYYSQLKQNRMIIDFIHSFHCAMKNARSNFSTGRESKNNQMKECKRDAAV